MATFMLNNESRPDIAVGMTPEITIGRTRFISPQIFPVWGTEEKANGVTVAQVVDGSATVNRSHGSALTGQQKNQVRRTYDLQKIEDRTTIDERDVKEHGGSDNAVKASALVSARTVFLQIEANAATTVISQARYNAAARINADAPYKLLADEARAVKRYGLPYLVCSESWLSYFVSLPQVAKTLLKMFGDRIIADLLTDTPAALNAVGQVFGVQGIMRGEDDSWAVSGKEDAAAVVAIRPEAQTNPLMTVKAFPSYGLGPTFLPDAASPETLIEILTGWDTAANRNVVDAMAWYEPLECNAAGAKAIKLPEGTVGS